MASHTKEQKEYIVRRLAAFETPTDVAMEFVANFRDTACTQEDVLATDPRIAIVDPDLHALFYSERERVLGDPRLAPYVDQRARMILYSRQIDRYERNNEPANARAVCRQIMDELAASGPVEPVGRGPITKITYTIIDPAAAS